MANLSARILVTHNARSLDGLATSDDHVIANGVLFRSDSLSALSEAGVAALAELGIGTVVDLRTDAERARAGDVLPDDGSVSLITLPVLGGAMDEMVKQLLPSGEAQMQVSPDQLTALLDQIPTLEKLYPEILASSAHQFVALARAVIDAAGTDRPGSSFTARPERTAPDWPPHCSSRPPVCLARRSSPITPRRKRISLVRLPRHSPGSSPGLAFRSHPRSASSPPNRRLQRFRRHLIGSPFITKMPRAICDRED